VGHQFFERLAGKCVELFQFELSLPEPNRNAVADAGRKVVHNRVLQLYSAGDIAKILRVMQGLRGGGGGAMAGGLADAMSTALKSLDDCSYPDESQRILLLLAQRTEQLGECDLDDVVRSTAYFFSEQLCHVEGVFRLPRDGLWGARNLIDEVSSSIAKRVGERITDYRQKDPHGWKHNRWRSPRAREKEVDIGADGQ
jgi:hypothetical protein